MNYTTLWTEFIEQKSIRQGLNAIILFIWTPDANVIAPEGKASWLVEKSDYTYNCEWKYLGHSSYEKKYHNLSKSKAIAEAKVW